MCRKEQYQGVEEERAPGLYGGAGVGQEQKEPRETRLQRKENSKSYQFLPLLDPRLRLARICSSGESRIACSSVSSGTWSQRRLCPRTRGVCVWCAMLLRCQGMLPPVVEGAPKKHPKDGFSSELCHLLAMSFWTCHFPSPTFSFLIYKMEGLAYNLDSK